MSGQERPEQRRVLVRLLTRAGWITGKLHVPVAQPLLDYLEEPRTFVSLSDVKLPAGEELSFLAVAMSGIVLVQPMADELVEAVSRSTSRTVLHQVSCLFEGGMVLGTLALSADRRVSDELLAAKGFVVVGHCTIGIDAPGKGPAVEAGIHVLVHAPALLGVTEH
ncbi:MAG: hypothetical protein KF901_12715 [Myxococcales bacterium]|nr:hypothetical protein [Myxococcales bacterium]